MGSSPKIHTRDGDFHRIDPKLNAVNSAVKELLRFRSVSLTDRPSSTVRWGAPHGNGYSCLCGSIRWPRHRPKFLDLQLI